MLSTKQPVAAISAAISLAIPWGIYSNNSDTFGLGGVSDRAAVCCSRSYGGMRGVGRAVSCFDGSWNVFALYHPPHQFSTATPALGSLCGFPLSEVPVGAEQKGDACGQCCLLSSIAW